MTFRSISHRGTVSTLLPELLRFTQRITHGIVGWQVLPTNIATPPKWDANFWKVGTRVGVKLGWKYLKIHETSWKFIVIVWELSISRMSNSTWCWLWLKNVLVGCNLKLRCLLCMTPCKVPGFLHDELAQYGWFGSSEEWHLSWTLRTPHCHLSFWNRKIVHVLGQVEGEKPWILISRCLWGLHQNAYLKRYVQLKVFPKCVGE